jgi:hypothetical protein
MFSFLVEHDGNAWETSGLMRMRIDRFNKFSDQPFRDSISLEIPSSLDMLKSSQAILTYERIAEGPKTGVARYGKLLGISVQRQEVCFRFSEEGIWTIQQVRDFGKRLGLTDFQFGHTHWAVKDGEVPDELLRQLERTYDVALSFAGEQRQYVEGVARSLSDAGVRVFFDDFERDDLWGKDLVEHFGMIFGKCSRYCVMFVSKEYSKKPWTTHERRAALAKAIEQETEYLLPVRFDDAELPGLRSTVKYLPAPSDPIEVAKAVMRKLGRTA